MGDEEGFVDIRDMQEILEELRCGAMMNALVESDILALRTHLVMRFRALGLTETGKLKLWEIKQALLDADQICLSRLQIHVLLCLAQPDTDSSGDVDIDAFIGTCCTIVPHMFDAKKFLLLADRLILLAAEEQKMRENAELALNKTTANVEEQEKTKEEEVDPETVEKQLIQFFTVNDTESRRKDGTATLSPEIIHHLMTSNDQNITSCHLSDFEIAGFVAEMPLDAEGKVVYVDHVKRMVPLIYELRKHCLLRLYVKEQDAVDMNMTMPDIAAYTAAFPLLPTSMAFSRTAVEVKEADPIASRSGSKRRPSMRRGTSKRQSSNTIGSDYGLDEESDGKSNAPPKGRPRASVMFGARKSSISGTLQGSDDLVRDTPHGRGYIRRRRLMGQPLMGTA